MHNKRIEFYERIDQLMKLINLKKLGEYNKYNNSIYSELLHFFDIIIESSQKNVYNLSVLDRFEESLLIK